MSTHLSEKIEPYRPIIVSNLEAEGIALDKSSREILALPWANMSWRGRFALLPLSILFASPMDICKTRWRGQEFLDPEILQNKGLALCETWEAIHLRAVWNNHDALPNKLVRVAMKPVLLSDGPHDFPRVLALESLAGTRGLCATSAHPAIEYTGDFHWFFRMLS